MDEGGGCLILSELEFVQRDDRNTECSAGLEENPATNQCIRQNNLGNLSTRLVWPAKSVHLYFRVSSVFVMLNFCSFHAIGNLL